MRIPTLGPSACVPSRNLPTPEFSSPAANGKTLLGQLEIRFLTQSISCCDAFTCTFLRARLQPPKGGEYYAKMPISIVPPFSLIAPPLPASDDGGTLISLIMRGWKRLLAQ